ncbi:methylmalonyl-CoA mutase family protein [Pelagicoccus sp. SDUM812003]|uniref:methylmalonyl-CoA mutase family protein n=1 Tax=Pelagicoccus sp. SDUM812003 TaxID=3041267 RepID=UPI00280F19BE|nr:methylmalonyl-CoA mutase family protein [Pelagicoccus sp. SDUM812003]MDQ8203802.1 methylmalonyl-CoA mutase family protein [Pelagicoccus sp. SDUM812003]
MSDTVKEPLLGDFEACSYEQWREAAERLLKGAPFDKKMLTKTPEGIVLQPIYRREDCSDLEAAESVPGQGDYTRGTKPQGYLQGGWEVAQDLGGGAPEEFNKTLLHALQSGQNAVRVRLDAATRNGLDPDQAQEEQVGQDGLSLACVEDLRKAFKEVVADAVPFYFETGCSGLYFASLFTAWLKETGVDLAKVSGGYNFDPLGVLASEGSLSTSLDALMDEAADLVKSASETTPSFRSIGVSGWPLHAAGASATEELAGVLANGVFYIRELVKRGVDVDLAAKQLQFNLAIGPDFFMEVAKLRAARKLWAKIVTSMGGSAEAAKMSLHARTGVYNKTKHDPYVNMLRGTTEAFSAVVGGADSICVGRFDEILRPNNEFANRIARNVQLVLQEECELTAVVDPAGGSWYVENLTSELSKVAWKAFQGIEKEGGAFESLKSGYVQGVVAATRSAKEKMLGQKRIRLVGTNNYPNLQEKPLEGQGVGVGALKADRSEAIAAARAKDVSIKCSGCLEGAAANGATIGQMVAALRKVADEKPSCEALPNKRLAEIYEDLRAASAAYAAKHGHGPKLFLANLGPLKKHKARADFTRSFFEAGGFDVIFPKGFDDDVSAVEAFKESGSKLVAICGTDPDYEERVPTLAKALKEATADCTIILAGYPGDKEAAYREAGMDDYIFIKSDNYETNKKFLVELGAL